jgi:hypothetical protein
MVGINSNSPVSIGQQAVNKKKGTAINKQYFLTIGVMHPSLHLVRFSLSFLLCTLLSKGREEKKEYARLSRNHYHALRSVLLRTVLSKKDKQLKNTVKTNGYITPTMLL